MEESSCFFLENSEFWCQEKDFESVFPSERRDPLFKGDLVTVKQLLDNWKIKDIATRLERVYIKNSEHLTSINCHISWLRALVD